MSIIQIIIIVFALFALSRAFLRYKDRLLALGEFLFWTVVWAAVIIVAIFPDIISNLSAAVGIGRGVDFAIYMSIILLFYLVYRIYVKLDELDQKVVSVMREYSIDHRKKK